MNASLPEEITVTVTADDIAAGIADSCTGCPVALAVRRALPPGAGPVSVAFDVHVYGQPDDYYRGQDAARGGLIGRYSLPDEARQFIIDFDNGRRVWPFTFQAREAGQP